MSAPAPPSAPGPAEPVESSPPPAADAPPAQELFEGGPGAAPPAAPPGPGLGRLRAEIARIAAQQLARWGNGTIKETDPRVRTLLQDYWATGTGNKFSAAQVGNPQFQASYPWSATFISWVMQQAGAGQLFHRSAGHADYISWAKENRLRNRPSPFRAYRITEVAPRPGDLVCKPRGNSGATYDNIRPGMTTHCDIVTEVRPGQLVTVGGNVSDSVGQRLVRTNAQGRIQDPEYFAVIGLEGEGLRGNGAPGKNGAPTAARLAAAIQAAPRITLATSHSSGAVDRATAAQNIADTAAGRLAARSSYGAAPGGTVALNARLLAGMLELAKTYTYHVTELAGGAHSATSRHYAGVAVDVGSINGTRVTAAHPDFRAFMARCQALGATEVLGPGSPGHDTHIHAAWPRP